VERFHRPSIVLGVADGVAQGSGRSIEAFHLLEALESMPELFTRFGGHAHAAGLTMPVASLESFRERLRGWAAGRLSAVDFQPVVEVDAVVELGEIGDPLWQALEQIAPFGMENPQPLFAVQGGTFAGPPQIWKEKHLRAALRQGGRTLMLKGWGMAGLAAELGEAKEVDTAFTIERDWMGGWGLTARAFRCQDSSAAD
jgi:single-stranded-DNA-specific exonuclease